MTCHASSLLRHWDATLRAHKFERHSVRRKIENGERRRRLNKYGPKHSDYIDLRSVKLNNVFALSLSLPAIHFAPSRRWQAKRGTHESASPASPGLLSLWCWTTTPTAPTMRCYAMLCYAGLLSKSRLHSLQMDWRGAERPLLMDCPPGDYSKARHSLFKLATTIRQHVCEKSHQRCVFSLPLFLFPLFLFPFFSPSLHRILLLSFHQLDVKEWTINEVHAWAVDIVGRKDALRSFKTRRFTGRSCVR